MPINCPFCGDPLINEFILFSGGHDRLNKSCRKKINHNITFSSMISNNNLIDHVYIDCINKSRFTWHLHTKKLLFKSYMNNGRKDLYLPYFDPHFSNFNKLMDKLKTYLVFS